MTPLEAMASAIDAVITSIYGSPPDPGEGKRMARAALLALAECDLPHRMECTNGDGRTVVYMNTATGSLFTAIVRALAEENVDA